MLWAKVLIEEMKNFLFFSNACKILSEHLS